MSPTTALLGMYPKELTAGNGKDSAPMFTAALFTKAKTWKQFKCHQQKNEQAKCGAYIYIWRRIVFSHKKGVSSDTCYNMDEPWRHYIKSNKSHEKGQNTI